MIASSVVVYVLEVRFDYNGKEEALYPVILKNKHQMILVDCGYAGFLPLIEDAAQKQGLSLQELTGVFITHHDIDHLGGLAELKNSYPALAVYAPVIEASYISGKEKSVRLMQAESLFESLPENQKSGALYFQEMLKNVQSVEVDAVFTEGETFMEGVKIINTPGHMPGHVSIYLPENQTLIAADALVIEHDEFEIANPAFTLDLGAAVESVKKLKRLQIKRMICYHGGVTEEGIDAKLAKLISRYPRPPVL
ncbi:MBL fold metallo-hydrolase [Runella aurantiaca]|uniref:MBL fold metallo-hydrolase n=1 Tax=Runella aurantiaca TaxID=2282308 RepID=A0A369IE92_9BACT|nr:MBL fold metallo-hydrolase [Runella aurantiaca]RDB06727.1 MBL fold metallo-hydrolase [Runella aurantiaca]